MTMQQDPMQLQNAFVLQTKPYRNTSLWVDLFTERSGRIAAIAHGARRPKNRYQAPIQSYVPLLVACRGKTELLTLQHIEPYGNSYVLGAERLLSALYLNELLARVLPRFDPYPDLFQTYQQSLVQLAHASSHCEITLRRFERTLLAELGYALTLSKEFKTGAAIQADQYYTYVPNQGFSLLNKQMLKHATHSNHAIFLGEHLLAIDCNQLEDPKILADAKRLMRIALAPRLGNKVLYSREIFIKMRKALSRTGGSDGL